MKLKVQSIATQIFQTGKSLNSFLEESLRSCPPQEGQVLAITSKIVSLAENRVVTREQAPHKETLVRKESDHFLGSIGYGTFLTVKHGLLIPSAGIDESNSQEGHYILFPVDPYESAQKIHKFIKDKFGLKNLGVLLTDSHTSPLRKGVTGIALSYWGFKAVRNFVGSQDLFGRELKMTQINYADALANAAVLMMGESNECTPLALIDCEGLEYTDHTQKDELLMPLESDLYYPLLKSFLKTKAKTEDET